MKHILVTGGSGQVGSYLSRYDWPQGVRAVAPVRAELDLADPTSIARVMKSQPWAAVINCGAYTAVDKAESDIVSAWQINALGPAQLAQETAAAGIPLIHVSTDYVFDGQKSSPYSETDAVAPLGVYGASKEGGEQAVRTGNPKHIIVRTAWVVSDHGQNFIKTMLRLGSQRPHLRVVDDQFGCPTHAGDLAQALAKIALQSITSKNEPSGTYHFSNAGSATWYGLAEELFSISARTGAQVPTLEPITTAQYPTPARRPANSRLSTDKITHDFGIEPRDWRLAILDIMSRLQNSAASQA